MIASTDNIQALSTRQIVDVASNLLKEVGQRALSVEPFAGGRNNRVYRVETDGEPVLMKAYFQHVDDQRDRLATEYQFARFLWDRGIRRIAQPLCMDRRYGLAMYRWVDGKPIETATQEDVDDALMFLREISHIRHADVDRQLPEASEACFDLNSHLGCVDQRVERVGKVAVSDDLHAQVQSFSQGPLRRTWEQLKPLVIETANRIGMRLNDTLSPGEQCLSPSDFGFHNALLQDALTSIGVAYRGGRLIYFDFEYAGWDDPAEMVNDFYCQPNVPAPPATRGMFVDSVRTMLELDERFVQRATLLEPVYRVKWACMLLNEFVPVDAQRRAFATTQSDHGNLTRQLQEARKMLRSVQVWLDRGAVFDLGGSMPDESEAGD